MDHLKSKIRHVPDFPKPGILFYDITTLLRDPVGLNELLEGLSAPFRDQEIDLIVGIESRGFILGAAMADRLGSGFVPMRKPGKLPGSTLRQSYELEYGQDTIEIHEDAVQKGERVLLVDDLLATGGTMAAACELVDSLGAEIVGIAFLIELRFLGGREKLGSREIFSAIEY